MSEARRLVRGPAGRTVGGVVLRTARRPGRVFTAAGGKGFSPQGFRETVVGYITNEDLERRLGSEAFLELTDDEGTGQPNAARADEARLGAEGEADSYFAVRYAVPVDLGADPRAAAVVRSFTLDLAAYRLHGRRPPVPPDVARRRDEAVAWLREVARGTAHLPASAALRDNPALGERVASAGPARSMTREQLDRL